MQERIGNKDRGPKIVLSGTPEEREKERGHNYEKKHSRLG